jgi:phosphoenolpyruvate carboxykinase (ATP)
MQKQIQKLYKDSIENFGCTTNDTNALVAYSGKYTGRQPQWKRIVKDDTTKDIWWDDVNIPMSPVEFSNACLKATDNIYHDPDKVYILDCCINWHPSYRVNIRLHTKNPYHTLFLQNMTIDTSPFQEDDIECNIYDSSDIFYKDDIGLIALNLTSNEMVIFGTEYAGEIKKSLLTYMMYKMPLINALPLHSSANIGKEGDITLFFGLSGTGKTTLSTEQNRKMIGDDEHVWCKDGVFNVEGGCYAKCKDLSRHNEPEIVDAIRFGAVLENVVLREDNSVDFSDVSITHNTRCAYPLEHLDNILLPAYSKNHPKNIVLLCCDAFGILPPIASLTIDQAVYFFLNGYTSKVAGTEQGVIEPQVTFSSCFGEPFLVHHPIKYGDLLKQYLSEHPCDVWLLNTGWIEGDYKTGRRIPIKYSREMLDCIHDGTVKKESYTSFPYFNIRVPNKCGNIPENILNPTNSDTTIKQLYDSFTDNYQKLVHNK